MKKLLYYFVCFLCCSIGLYSCSNDDEASIEPQISITGSDDYFLKGVTFTSNTGEETLSFISNVDWAITVANTANGEKWCTVTPNSGKAGENAVKIKVDANDGVDDRSVSLTLRAGELTKTILVTQKQKDALTLTSNKFEVAKNGGTINIEVKSNVDFEVIIPENCKNWITQSAKTRGLSTHNLSFNIAPSEEYDKREGEIIIQSGKLSETVHVYQTGEGILLLTKNEFSVSDRGEDIVVEVKSNFDFDVRMPNVDWVKEAAKTRGMSSHTLYYTIAKNESYDSREAEIVFYDKNSAIKESLKIMQVQKNAIILDEKEVKIAQIGGEFEVKVDGNVDYNINIDCSWIKERKYVNTRGLKSTIHKFIVETNDTEKDRLAEIKFTSATGLSESVIIKQRAFLTLCVDVKNAGTLNEYIKHEELFIIDSLTISGKIDGTDVVLLRRMSKLKYLNMENLNIVSGGAQYYIYGDCKTEDGRIGNWMFYNLNIVRVILPKNITAIGEYAFSACYNLRDIVIPESVISIGDAVFYECSSLKSIVIPNSISVLPNSAFSRCGLSSIVIPESVTRIGKRVFQQCFSIENITIPSSVRSIEDNAFLGLRSLKEIHIKPMPEKLFLGRSVFSEYESAKLYIPKGTKEAYCLTELGNFKTIIEE